MGEIRFKKIMMGTNFYLKGSKRKDVLVFFLFTGRDEYF